MGDGGGDLTLRVRGHRKKTKERRQARQAKVFFHL